MPRTFSRDGPTRGEEARGVVRGERRGKKGKKEKKKKRKTEARRQSGDLHTDSYG